MAIYCPICNEPIDHDDDTVPEHVFCPACGSTMAMRQRAAAAGERAQTPRSLGRFELLEVIGCGAFGTVYKARDPGLDRLVAVKVPHPGESTAAGARFLREARSAAQLHHPVIVPIHEVGEDRGTPYLVSELVAGSTLADCLQARRFAPAEAARLVAALADGLHYAHTQGVIHRDVKPTNVMLDAAGEPRLLDFGLALRDAGEVTMTTEGQVLGTPAYMSPEQARGEGHAVDGRTDVYSLGAVLYQLLTGEPPFRGNVRMVLRQVLEEEPRPPRRLNDRVPRDLETICLKCLEKDPARRYGTAAALADDLRRFVAGRPVLARPVPPAAKLVRWCRRNPALAGALAAAFLALGAGVAVSLAFARAQAENAKGLETVNDELRRTDQRRRQALRQATYLARDRGLALCEQGEADLGLLWLTRALEIGPEDDPELAESLKEERAHLGAWRGRVCTPLTLLAPEEQVAVLAFSPDGRLLLTGAPEGAVALWRADTGELLGRPWRHNGPAVVVAFSSDGLRFVTSNWNGPARVGDAATGRPLGGPLPNIRDGLLALSPDGKTIAEQEEAAVVRLREVDTGRPVGETIRPGGGVRVVAFSPDGKLLVTGGTEGKPRLWDAATGKAVGEGLPHPGAVYGAAFSPDGKTLLTWGQDGTARLWEVATGRARGSLGHQQPVNAAAFSPDGLLIATGTGDQPEKGEARVWEAATGRQVGVSMSHPTSVRKVAFSRDGGVVLTCCQDGLARFWEAASGRAFGAPLRHPAPLRTAAFSPDGSRVATAAESGGVRLWGAVPDRPAGVTLSRGPRVAGVAFSPDGRLLATAGWDRTARLWDVATGRQVGEAMQHPDFVLAVAFSRDGRTILTGCRDKVARLWDATTQQPTGPVFHHKGAVSAVAFGPGDTILTGTPDDGVRLRDATTGKEVGEPMDCARVAPALAISPDQKLVLTNGPHPGAHLWEAATGRPAGRGFAHPGFVTAMAFSPDGRQVLTGGIDRTARRWDAASGEALGEPLAHAQPVGTAAFSGDGLRMATGSLDGNVRLWEARSGRAFGPPLPHAQNAWVWGVALSPDGTVVATGTGAPYGESGEGRLWPVPPPVTGSPERLAAWVRVQTGMELDGDGVAHLLDETAWEQARRRMDELEVARR